MYSICMAAFHPGPDDEIILDSAVLQTKCLGGQAVLTMMCFHGMRGCRVERLCACTFKYHRHEGLAAACCFDTGGIAIAAYL